MELDSDEVRLRSTKAEQLAALRRLQAYVRSVPKSSGAVVDELIAERRAEAARK